MNQHEQNDPKTEAPKDQRELKVEDLERVRGGAGKFAVEDIKRVRGGIMKTKHDTVKN